MSIERNVVTIPTAANDSVALTSILPTTAASVNDKIGSDTPEINAGIASLLIFFKLMDVVKIRVHNNKKEIHFVGESKHFLIVCNREVRKIFGSCYFGRRYLIE